MPFRGLLGSAVSDDSDFTHRLQTMRPATEGADPRMVAQPPIDPGYAMPNVDLGNLNQMPGQDVSGWLPSSLTDDEKQQLLRRALQTLSST